MVIILIIYFNLIQLKHQRKVDFHANFIRIHEITKFKSGIISNNDENICYKLK